MLPDGIRLATLTAGMAATAHAVPLRAFERFRNQHPRAAERIMRNLAQLRADRLIVVNAKVDLLTSGENVQSQVPGRSSKIFGKLLTNEQPFRQKQGGLKPGLDGERYILFPKRGSRNHANLQIFCRRRIDTTRILVHFRRLLRRRREQFALQRVAV